jgi:hypothetical protein
MYEILATSPPEFRQVYFLPADVAILRDMPRIFARVAIESCPLWRI